MKILYMGTPDFAVPSLLALIENNYEICGVLTQPDKPKGRGHKLTPPPVKECALSHNIPVFQPETLKNEAFSEELKTLNPDIIVVAAYGKILPSYILDYPKYGCINIHGSILPKYRGAAPIQRAIIDGEAETGITIQLMNEGIDTGDILFIEKIPIGEKETAGELFDRLSLIGAKTLLKTLEKIENGSITRTPQNHDEATYAKMLDKETGKIDWSKSAKEIFSLIKGTNPYPVAHTLYKGEVLKIYTADVGGKTNAAAGEIIGLPSKKIEVACGDGVSLLISEVQLFGKKRMDTASFLNGNSIDIGELLS
ncbi:MAG: methionyl-tRNA formyltransferase [Ruminococcaceae bacterium]|nr:methionyl-tRNA formyltransferase [Oscillospiraceae bacterium]